MKQERKVAAAMHEHASPTIGIGGFLAVFLVTLGVISPFGGLLRIALEQSARQQVPLAGPVTLRDAHWALMLAEGAAQMFLASRLWRCRRRAIVRQTVVGIWLIALADIVLKPLLWAWAFDLTWWLVVRQTGPGAWRPLIFTTVWSAYLLLSPRVAATYPAEQSAATLGRVFD